MLPHQIFTSKFLGKHQFSKFSITKYYITLWSPKPCKYVNNKFADTWQLTHPVAKAMGMKI